MLVGKDSGASLVYFPVLQAPKPIQQTLLDLHQGRLQSPF